VEVWCAVRTDSVCDSFLTAEDSEVTENFDLATFFRKRKSVAKSWQQILGKVKCVALGFARAPPAFTERSRGADFRVHSLA
jgi:hypothetical protein